AVLFFLIVLLLEQPQRSMPASPSSGHARKSGRPPCGGRTKEFAEPVSLSSTSSNRPFASGLLPLRPTARSWFRPTCVPCSAQEGTYANAVTGSRPAGNIFVAICAPIIFGGRTRRCPRPGRTADGRP